MIYRTMIFGHRNSFGVHRVVIGSPEGVPGGPEMSMGLMGQGEGHTNPQGGWCAPSLGWPTLGEGKGRGGPSCLSLLRRERKGGRHLLLPSSRTPNKEGAPLGGRPQVGFGLLGAPPWLLHHPPTYIYVGGGATHSPRQSLSLYDAPLHIFVPRLYFRSA